MMSRRILSGHLHKPVVPCVKDLMKFQLAADALLCPVWSGSSLLVGPTRGVWREFAELSFDACQGRTTWKFSGGFSGRGMDGFKSFVLKSIAHAVQ